MKPTARRLPPGADALYGGPLDAFVAARTELEKKLRAKGETAAAAEVKRLEKPSISAWVVNQLWRSDREDFTRLLQARTSLQRASRAADASAAREAAKAQSAVVARLRKRASETLVAATHASSATVLGRVTTTLRALAAKGTFAPDPPGALARDVEPSGFEAFGGVGLGAFRATAQTEKHAAERAPPATTHARPKRVAGAGPRVKGAKRKAEDAKRKAEDAKRTSDDVKRAARERAEANRKAKAVAAAARALGRAETKLTAARRALDGAARRVRTLEDHVATAREALARTRG